MAESGRMSVGARQSAPASALLRLKCGCIKGEACERLGGSRPICSGRERPAAAIVRLGCEGSKATMACARRCIVSEREGERRR
eukprot:scaffold85228_cov26-Tisochrysis_lutea.AAC.1